MFKVDKSVRFTNVFEVSVLITRKITVKKASFSISIITRGILVMFSIQDFMFADYIW